MSSNRISMKKSKYSESQIFSILKEGASGIPVSELCHKHGMSDATFYNWRAKYGGMDVSMMKRMKADVKGRRPSFAALRATEGKQETEYRSGYWIS